MHTAFPARTTSAAALSALLFAAAGCDGGPPASRAAATAAPVPAAPSAPVAPATSAGPRPLAGEKLGDPLPGLTDAQLAAFRRGKALFEKRFEPDEGLGPHYNATSCASCHSTPAVGGSSELYRNFYLVVHGAAPFQSAFPELPSAVVPAFGPSEPGGVEFTLEQGRFSIPSDYFGAPVVVAQRNALPLFGTGLFEFVDNATILAHADPFDLDGDGVSGRANYDFGGLGRFGVKSQSNNIERFTRPPLQNQMGITSDPFLGSAGTISLASAAAQVTGDPDLPTTDQDSVPDPEISTADLGDLIAFVRFLAPPPRLPFTARALQGEVLFEQIECTTCHVPTLASSRGPLEAYSDLLLHDMGPDLADGLQFGAPSPGGISTAVEYRTQPLWGVALHAPFLHDGRAATLYDAVDAHGGEAQSSRDRFVGLTVDEQDALIEFLEHL